MDDDREKHFVVKALEHFSEQLGELETVARKLPEHSFADLIKGARGRLAQAMGHPDVAAIGELARKASEREEPKLPFG